MEKPITYTVKAKVTKAKRYSLDEYTVVVEGSGFAGEATEMSLGSAFQHAYEDLMAKVSEAIFKDDA